MANGRSHAAAAAGLLTAAAVASGAAIYLAPSPTTVALAVGAVLGAMGGLLVTPDIDQVDITHEERRLIRLFAPLGWLWTLYWAPYSLVMPHRGWSHTVPWGTLGRILYVAIPAGILAYIAGLRLDTVSVQYLLYGTVTAFIMWSLQDILHMMMDGLWPGRAPWRKPAWQPKD